jgi:hypothetical protein
MAFHEDFPVRLLASVAAAALCGVPAAAFAQPVADPAPAPAATDQPVPAESPADETAPADPAAEADAEVVDDLGDEEIVVTGQRLRGAVEGDIPPEITLNPREIRAFGASTIAELLQALSPQTSSGRGRGGGGGFPVVLVNGRRISSFSEIRDLPPEAIERVDILPEEVALRYGYRAEQRVVNLVLRERFNAVTAEVDAGLATAGGRGVGEVDVNYLTIRGPTRTSFDVEYQNQAALLESERDIIQTRTGPPGVNVGDFRTLLPQTEQMSLAGNHSRMFGSIGATVDGRFVNSSNASLLGLPSDDPASRTALRRESETWNGHVGLTLNGSVAPWRWNVTANLDRVETDTITQRLAAAPADKAEQINQSATANLVASGPVLEGWAGPLNASLNVAGELRSFDSQSTRAGVFRETSLSRQRVEGQASFDLPITSTREGVLDAIGDLSLNLNLNAEYLSDFGALTTIGYGLNWRPVEEVSVIASFTREEGAPGITQLGDPVIATPNVRVFDFVRGETVDITRIDGGNPALIADSRRVINLGVNVRPTQSLSVRANYTENKIENPIAGFPAATAEIEAAFPDRFMRDVSGRLLSIDARPINFAQSERREFRWGIDFSAPLGAQRQGGGGPLGAFFGGGAGGGQGGGGRRRRVDAQPPSGAQQPPGGAAGAQGQQPPVATPGQPQPPEGQQGERRRGQGGGFGGRGGGGGGRGAFGGGGGGRAAFGGGFGRINLSLFHTWRLEDRVLIREGGPELDFLNGSAAGSFGGTPRHQVEFRANIFRDGFGARAEVDWQSGTQVRGVNGSDLSFSDQTRVNLRLFADLGAQRGLVREWRFLRGARVSLSIDNLFNSRVDVRDASGQTPLNYQPFLVDPLGRSVRISLRKLFF